MEAKAHDIKISGFASSVTSWLNLKMKYTCGVYTWWFGRSRLHNKIVSSRAKYKDTWLDGDKKSIYSFHAILSVCLSAHLYRLSQKLPHPSIHSIHIPPMFHRNPIPSIHPWSLTRSKPSIHSHHWNALDIHDRFHPWGLRRGKRGNWRLFRFEIGGKAGEMV